MFFWAISVLLFITILWSSKFRFNYWSVRCFKFTQNRTVYSCTVCWQKIGQICVTVLPINTYKMYFRQCIVTTVHCRDINTREISAYGHFSFSLWRLTSWSFLLVRYLLLCYISLNHAEFVQESALKGCHQTLLECKFVFYSIQP